MLSNLQELALSLLFRYRYFVISLVLGIALFAFGAAILGSNLFEETKVEIIKDTDATDLEQIEQIYVEISGSVQNPGVYKFNTEARVDDLLVKAGGLGVEADRGWVEKNLNRAAKLTDGQKIYIPHSSESSSGQASTTSTLGVTDKININSASLKELDSLEGIGAVRAQAIIDNRPYATIEQLIEKKVIPKSVFDKIKDEIIAQ